MIPQPPLCLLRREITLRLTLQHLAPPTPPERAVLVCRWYSAASPMKMENGYATAYSTGQKYLRTQYLGTT
jgi:hypothetical protein